MAGKVEDSEKLESSRLSTGLGVALAALEAVWMSSDKLKKDIRELVHEVVDHRFDKLDNGFENFSKRFDKIDAEFKEVKDALKKLLPPSPPKP